jgi:lipopolysaccharide/colanic/teichoic acid biosynthesis glycosyltransferase
MCRRNNTQMIPFNCTETCQQAAFIQRELAKKPLMELTAESRGIREKSLDAVTRVAGSHNFNPGRPPQVSGDSVPSIHPANVTNIYRRWIKRAIDATFGFAGLVVYAPVIFVVAVLIRMIMGRPILFRQERPGLNGLPFTCLKFRTMTIKQDEKGQLLSDRDRMVPLGAWLRRTSLDELPQLWNIVQGDLSFIGPRPLLKEYLPYYTLEEQRRHSVRPGLTGWAQIHGRNDLGFDERLKMDVWYVDQLSWHLDLRILLATIRVVFTAKGTDLVSYPPLNEQRRLNLKFQSLEPRAGTQSERAGHRNSRDEF